MLLTTKLTRTRELMHTNMSRDMYIDIRDLDNINDSDCTHIYTYYIANICRGLKNDPGNERRFQDQGKIFFSTDRPKR